MFFNSSSIGETDILIEKNICFYFELNINDNNFDNNIF